jgi:hypothetical protein
VPQCEAITKKGDQCRGKALPGQRLCRLHAATPEQRALWAARGGRRSTQADLHIEDRPETLSDAEWPRWARLHLAHAVLQVRAGEIPPPVAQAVGSLCGHILRACEMTDLRREVQELEERLGAMRGDVK